MFSTLLRPATNEKLMWDIFNLIHDTTVEAFKLESQNNLSSMFRVGLKYQT